MRLLDSALTVGPWASVLLVQVTLLALLGCLAWLAAQRGQPALRSAIVLAALVGLLLAPALCFVVPVWMPLPEWVWRAGSEPLTVESSDGVAPPSASPSGDATVYALFVPQLPAKDSQVGDDPAKQADEIDAALEKTEAVVFKLVSSPDDAAQPARSDNPRGSSWTWVGLLASIWLLGAAACLLRALIRLALLYRCAWKARPVRKRAWTDCLASLTRQYGQAKVALRESQTLASPLTLGLLWPVILLPCGLRRGSAEQRVLILEHELAHIRRRDFLAGLAAELAVCLWWFHPLVRWLAGQLRLEQEYAADACVATAGTDSNEYLRCLARLALELERGHGPLAPTFWRRRPEIMRRIDMLRRNAKDFSPQLGKRAVFTVAMLAAAICLAVSGIGAPRSNAEGEPFGPTVAGTTEKAATDTQGDPLPDGALARLGTMRMRHGAEVTFVAFGPRGETLLTAGRDNTIRLWDLNTGREIRRFSPPKPVNPKPTIEGDKEKAQAAVVKRFMGGAGNEAGNPRVALSPDGTILAVGGGNVIQLYDVKTGRELRQIEGPTQGAASLLFSPDGRTLAARTANGTFLFWNTDTGKEIRQIKPAPRPQQEAFVVILGGGAADAPGMAFTPDGKGLAAAATDFKEQEPIGSVKLWDLATGNEIRRIHPPENRDVSVVAISPDGEVLAYGDNNTIHLCDMKTGKELRQLNKLPGIGITTLRFAADARTLAVRSRDQRVSLWDTQTGKEIRLLSEAQPLQQGNGLVFVVRGFPSPEARALAISQDGKYAASTSGSTVRLWEITTGKELQLTEGHRRTPIILAVSRDGKTVVSWGDDRVVRRWDAFSGKSLGAFPAPPGTTSAALSADGRTVAFANTDNTIRLHESATGKELHRIRSHTNGIATLAFSADGRMLASRGSGDNSIRLHDVTTGGELRQFTLRTERNNADGTRFRVVSLVGSPRTAAGAGMAFTPDNKLLIVPGPGDNPGKTLIVCEVTTAKELRRIQSPQAVTSLTISPDGRTLAAENADHTVSLWEIASGKLRCQLGKPAAEQPLLNGPQMRVSIAAEGIMSGFNEPTGPVGLAFSADGRALAARSADQSVRMWDVDSGHEIGRLKGHQGRTQTVAFAPDGRTLASGATDTTILLWDTTTPMKELAKVQTVEAPNAEMETRWSDLAADNAAKAFESVRKLSAAPRQAVPFLGSRLKPAARIDPRMIEGWIADLESDRYSIRQQAIASLLKTGEQALPALRQVLAASPRLETRKRVEELVLKLIDGNLRAEQLQLVRSVEVLERIGSEEAQRILRMLAQGPPETLPTREAEAALKRLAEHSPAQR